MVSHLVNKLYLCLGFWHTHLNDLLFHDSYNIFNVLVMEIYLQRTQIRADSQEEIYKILI